MGEADVFPVMLSHGKASDICTWASEDSFFLLLTAMHFPGDLWILTAEKEESSRQGKQQHKPSSTMWVLSSALQSIWGQAAMEEGAAGQGEMLG